LKNLYLSGNVVTTNKNPYYYYVDSLYIY